MHEPDILCERPSISVVIPVLNERERLPRILEALSAHADLDEVVVVDGGSRDGTVEWLQQATEIRWVRAAKGRGAQLHAGACAARGDILWFLHADAEVPPEAGVIVRGVLGETGVVAGAFRTRTSLAEGEAAWFRPVLRLADLRAHYTRDPYGDQGLFCLRSAYHQCGGAPDQPIFEDLELSRRLRRVGRLRVHPVALRVSARRWVAHPWRTAWVMHAFPLLYRLGVSPERLARRYGAPR